MLDETELRELYQELIIDHGTSPRNFRNIPSCSHQAEGFNPLCGDKIELFISLSESDQKITDIAFQGHGCAISTASASLMTEALLGKTEAEAALLFENFKTLLLQTDHSITNNKTLNCSNTSCITNPEEPYNLGKLCALQGVRAFPTRVKCATLPWHTLHAALKKLQEKATTE